MGTTGNEAPETNQHDEEIRIRNLIVIQDLTTRKQILMLLSLWQVCLPCLRFFHLQQE